LEVSKQQTAQLELQLTEIPLISFLSELIGIFRDQARHRDINFHYQPAVDLPLEIMADGKRLRQILLNLLSNAIKFTQQGEITFQVQRESITERPGWAYFHFIITDTGCGIATDDLEKIFVPFEKITQWQHKSEGAGLGLSLTKQWVELMGGTITINSQLGLGSTFTINLDFQVVTELVSTQETLSIMPEPVSIISLKGPSAQKAAELYELTLMGDFNGILKLIAKLEKEDPELHPFTEKVRELAKDYRDELIGELAMQFMEIPPA